MDRVRPAGRHPLRFGRKGALAPTLLAAVALLGEQGARIGPHVVPPIGFSWVVIALAVLFFLTQRREGGRATARDAVWAAALILTFLPLSLWRTQTLDAPLSSSVLVDGQSVVRVKTLQIEERRELRRLAGRRRNVTLSAAGEVEVPEPGRYRFELDCDDACNVTIAETRARDGDVLELDAGSVPFEIDYRQLGGPARLRFGWDTPSFVELLPMEYFIGSSGSSRRVERVRAHANLLLCILWWAALSIWLARLARYRAELRSRRLIPATAAVAIILYGSLLRYNAFQVHSGYQGELPLSRWMPSYGLFNPAYAPEDPYRADVRSYLDRAETLTWSSFYAPSFREPFYVALTKPFLALSGHELGILLQSMFFSCITLVLFHGIATRLFGWWWGVGLLVPVALHQWLVMEAATGYRMSAYAFFLLASAAATFLMPVRRWSAFGAGVISGLLCLIRLSALSVVVPLLLLRLWPLTRRERLDYGVPFVLALMVLVGPFLVSNAAAHGDPFYSISFHTEFWMRAEGLDPHEGPVSWTRYFTDFGRTGNVVRGTLLGLTVLPIVTFWNGLRSFPILDVTALLMGVAGLVLAVRSDERFLTAAYFAHLIPFAYIQNFPSGQMPRFVMPSYFFLVLAAPLAVKNASAAWSRLRRRRAES